MHKMYTFSLQHTTWVTFWNFVGKGDFYKIARMPRVIGAVDGSLIPIRAPYNDEHMYVCHKGFHAVNAMAVCNAHLSFTNFVCRWQGSFHDSAVFNGSMLHALMYLVGHCNSIPVVVALLLQQLRCCTICAYLTKHHSLTIQSNPLMNQTW